MYNERNTLTVGNRGSSLLEDSIFREKMTRFDQERIPERIVHAEPLYKTVMSAKKTH